MSLYIGPWQEMKLSRWISANQTKQPIQSTGGLYQTSSIASTAPVSIETLSDSRARDKVIKQWRSNTTELRNVFNLSPCQQRLKQKSQALKDKSNDIVMASQEYTSMRFRDRQRNNVGSGSSKAAKNGNSKKEHKPSPASGLGNSSYDRYDLTPTTNQHRKQSKTITCCSSRSDGTGVARKSRLQITGKKKSQNETKMDRVNQMRWAYTIMKEVEQTGNNIPLKDRCTMAEKRFAENSPFSCVSPIISEEKDCNPQTVPVGNNFSKRSQSHYIDEITKAFDHGRGMEVYTNEETIIDSVDQLIQWAQQLSMEGL